MSARIQLRGVEGVRKMLAPWLEPELSKELDAATKAAATLLGKELKAELRPVSKHMSRAVRVKRAKRDRPGWVVGSRRKTPPGAFWWHFVIGGTREHGPRSGNENLVFVPNWNPYLGASSHGIDTGRVVRAKRVRGVPPNPVVARVAKRHEAQAYAAIDRALPKE